MRGQLGERRRDEVDRVARQLRIGDVALHALDGQRARQRAAAAVLDHVAERARPTSARRRCSSRCARRAPRACSTTLTVPSIDGPSSSDVISSAIEPGAAGCARDELLDRHDERRERGLHVGRAAAVELAVAQRRHERIAAPRVERAGRHDVGVAGEADERARASPRRAQRLVTPLDCSVSQPKPSGASRCAISAWQPASSGVTERRAISSRASASDGCGCDIHPRHGSKRGLRLSWRQAWCTQRPVRAASAGMRCDGAAASARAFRGRSSCRRSRAVVRALLALSDSASTRDVGVFWLMSQARLVGESDATSPRRS